MQRAPKVKSVRRTAATDARAKAAARGAQAKTTARGAQAKRAARSAQSTAKAKRQKQQERIDVSMVTLENKIKLCRQHGVGCRYCASNCFSHFQCKLNDVRRWRTEFRNLPNEETRDMHIYWMFCKAPQQETRRQQQGAMLVHCETSSDEAEFKTSGEEEEVAAQASSFQTDSEAGEEVDAKARSFHTDSEAGEEVDAKAGFNTSSSDNDEPNVRAKASSSSAKPAPAKPARNSAYAVAVLGKEVCVKAAAKLLGIGSHRLSRVRHGEGDSRRLPKPCGPGGMPLKADSATSSCLTFLWRAQASAYSLVSRDWARFRDRAKVLANDHS